MKKLLAFFAAWAMATAAQAQYRLIVPQAPGGGTSVWATVMAPHLSRALGEPVIVEHIPGAKAIPGFNRFHNQLQHDPKTIMVAHGGNAESFLTDQVDYDYGQYAPIAMVNLNIAVSRRADFDIDQDQIKFGGTSGRRPDVMAIVMMACGPRPSTSDYIACYRERMTFVNGMRPTDARLAVLRGELNVTRETFVSYKKFVEPEVAKGVFVDWFNHGVLDLATGGIVQDKNFEHMPTFAQAYRARWGVTPAGEFYDAYVLAKSYRDVLQKSLWVGNNNPNADRLRDAVGKMLADPQAREEIIRDGGDYEWLIGADMAQAYQIISSGVTESALKNLYQFTVQGLGLDAVYKPVLIGKQ